MWEIIPEFPSCEINEHGTVRRLLDSKTSKSGKTLKSHPNTFGYLSVQLREKKRSYRRTVHNYGNIL